MLAVTCSLLMVLLLAESTESADKTVQDVNNNLQSHHTLNMATLYFIIMKRGAEIADCQIGYGKKFV